MATTKKFQARDGRRDATIFGCDGDHPYPPAPGNQSRRFPIGEPMGPPPLRGLWMVPVTARVASRPPLTRIFLFFASSRDRPHSPISIRNPFQKLSTNYRGTMGNKLS